VLSANGPCKTWTAWLVTLPVAEAEGPAIFVLEGACCALPDALSKKIIIG